MTAAQQREGLSQELPAVSALRALSIFSAEQSGAYREHYAALAQVLGEDVETRLARHVRRWARSGDAGAIVLTGNAGTGKTAVAEAYCRALHAALPAIDVPVEVAAGRWVVKDLSGLPDAPARLAALRTVLQPAREGGQALVCANEGVMRDALQGLDAPDVQEALETALRQGAAAAGPVTVVNANRQRPTASRLWGQLLDYVTREELWGGCEQCPFDTGGCPMRSNAQALRRPEVREQLRTLVRLGTGEAVPTLREVLAILSWAIVGPDSCAHVKGRVRDMGEDAFTASSGYYARVVGGGLAAEAVERSPLMTGMRRAGLGEVSDLEADGWLRDTTGAPHGVRVLAGDPGTAEPPPDGAELPRRPAGLQGSRSPLDRVLTNQRAMTFQALGEMVSTDEDPTRVEDGLRALVAGDERANAPGQSLWRQRLYFEASTELGGSAAAARRLLDYRYLPDLVALAGKAAAGEDTVLEAFRDGIEVVAVDPSAPFAAALRDVLPHATLVVDHWHLHRLANLMVTQTRQRVTQQVHGHRGRASNDSWAYRRLLLRGARHLSDKQWARLRELFTTDDPTGEIQASWAGKELLRQLLDALPATGGPLVIDPRRDPAAASRGAGPELRPYEIRARLERFYALAAEADVPELTRLAGTVETWWPAIEAYLHLRVTNARTEGYNRKIKQIKRVACGFRNQQSYERRIMLNNAATAA